MSSITREFPLSDEMKRLLNVTRVYVKGKTLFVENRRSEPITCPYTGELVTTTEELKQALIDTHEFEDKLIDKLIRFLSDVWRKQEEESPFEEEDEKREKKYFVQKYTNGIPPAESILIGGTKPMFLQIIDGKAKLSEKISLPDITLSPLDRVSYLNKEYSFSSEEEINQYIKKAKMETLDITISNRFAKGVWMQTTFI
ncbi:MAG: hypothetical protein WAM14_02945 [Candidatus Nitrosopolaris sp.]